MKDRIPTRPGRVLITPESGTAYYATLTRADEPSEVGTPLNTASLLKDATAALMALPATATPDDMFAALAEASRKIEYGSYVGSGENYGDDDVVTGISYAQRPILLIVCGFDGTTGTRIALIPCTETGSVQPALLESYLNGAFLTANVKAINANVSEDGAYWYASSDADQLNIEDTTYKWIAIGGGA